MKKKFMKNVITSCNDFRQGGEGVDGSLCIGKAEVINIREI
jgi:hypothetical protein